MQHLQFLLDSGFRHADAEPEMGVDDHCRHTRLPASSFPLSSHAHTTKAVILTSWRVH